MKKKMIPFLTGAGILLTSMSAQAVLVQIDGDPCPLIIKTAGDEGTVTLEKELTEFELYGYTERNLAVISYGEEERTFAYVTKKELQEKLPEIPAADLADGTKLADINSGASGEQVIALQEQLIAAGYLEGEADGGYGGGTAAAISALQEAHRLPVTGNADIYTQMLLLDEINGIDDVIDTVYPMYTTPEEKFARINGQTEADLTPYVDSDWRFHYDAFEQFGTIDPSITLGTASIEGSDIDRLSLSASLKVVVTTGAESDLLDVLPAIVVETEGAYRPYLQSVILDGSRTLQVEGGVSSGELQGAKLQEFGYVPLSQEALELLSTGSVQTLRIKGKNNTYDVKIEADQEDLIWFAQSVMQ